MRKTPSHSRLRRNAPCGLRSFTFARLVPTLWQSYKFITSAEEHHFGEQFAPIYGYAIELGTV
jgi:hypothetical protein